MKKSGALVLTFIAGLSVGAGVTWVYAKKRYEKIIDVEVTSARETYNQLARDLVEKNNMEKKKMYDELSKDVNQYYEEIENNGYAENIELEEIEHDLDEYVKKPVTGPYDSYEISMDEYGSFEDYNLISLNYYSDGIITDDQNEILDDASDFLGDNIINALSEYDEKGYAKILDNSCCYVRNDTRKCDYEILLTDCDFEDSQI